MHTFFHFGFVVKASSTSIHSYIQACYNKFQGIFVCFKYFPMLKVATHYINKKCKFNICIIQFTSFFCTFRSYLFTFWTKSNWPTKIKPNATKCQALHPRNLQSSTRPNLDPLFYHPKASNNPILNHISSHDALRPSSKREKLVPSKHIHQIQHKAMQKDHNATCSSNYIQGQVRYATIHMTLENMAWYFENEDEHKATKTKTNSIFIKLLFK